MAVIESGDGGAIRFEWTCALADVAGQEAHKNSAETGAVRAHDGEPSLVGGPLFHNNAPTAEPAEAAESLLDIKSAFSN